MAMEAPAPGITEASPHAPSQFNIDILSVIRNKWWVSVATVSLGILLSVAYWYCTAPTYQSTVQLLVMTKDPRLATAGVTGSTDSGGVSEDVLATHMQILQSKKGVEQALRANGLYTLPSILMNLDLERGETPTDYVIDRLNVTRGGNGQAKTANVLNIAFRHAEADEAQQIVEAIVARYQAFVKEKFEDVNEEAAGLINEAREELEAELASAEQAHVEMRTNAPLLWSGDESSNIHRMNYEQIQTELADLQLQTAEARARLRVVNDALTEDSQSAESVIQILALIDDKSLARFGIVAEVFGKDIQADIARQTPLVTSAVRAETESLLALVAKEETLLIDYGPRHPEVLAVRKQIDTLRNFLAQKGQSMSFFNTEDKLLEPKSLVDTYTRLLKHDLASAERRAEELLIIAGKEEEAAKEMIVYELEDETLRAQVMRKQELYEAVVERLRNINLARDYGSFINEVIADAQIGEDVWPNLPVCLALGIIAGIGLGIGGSVALDITDRSFRTPDEVGRLLELPILAQVPSLKQRKKDARFVEGSTVDNLVCTFHSPRSTQAEVFRGLRTQLFFASQKTPIHVLSVTSPKPGDGKSTMTANLAFSLAQAGRRVLLVDCDLRKPRAHTLIGIDNACGIANAMSENLDPWEMLHPIPGSTLTFLPAGTIPDNPAEILESQKFAAFLEEAKQRFDLVVLDCPPVLRVSDPCIVASRVDGVILTVRVTKDTKPETRMAMDLLEQTGAPILGLVLNCWDLSQTMQGYGGYGYGAYGAYSEPYGDSDSSRQAA